MGVRGRFTSYILSHLSKLLEFLPWKVNYFSNNYKNVKKGSLVSFKLGRKEKEQKVTISRPPARPQYHKYGISHSPSSRDCHLISKGHWGDWV